MKWSNKGHEFDSVAVKICSHVESCKYYIWGAGTFGRAFYGLFKDKIHIIGFVDSKPEKQNTMVDGVKVYAPAVLKDTDAIVLVSTGWTHQVYTELNKMGFKKHETYFHIDEFTSVYMLYKENKIYVSDITYTITERCSLKCKNCNGFIPHLKEARNYEKIDILKNPDMFFQWCDYVNVLALCGGDAMVHPEFASILELVGERYYPKKAGNIEVYSNAVIVPDEAVLKMMKKYNVYYRFSDYRPYTEGRQKVEEIITLLKNNGIRYDHVKFEKWCDCGYPQESNGIQGESNLIKFFERCDRRSCHNLTERGVIFCGMAHAADRVGYCAIEEEEYFKLENYEQARRNEFLEYMLGYSEKGYHAYCAKCNGGANVNHNLIEAGEQM